MIFLSSPQNVNGIKNCTMLRMVTEHRFVSVNHSNVVVIKCKDSSGPLRHHTINFHPRCRLRLSGRCSNNMLVVTVPRNPHQQLLILKTATFFSGSIQQPFKKLHACFKFFCNFGMMYLCRVNDFLYICTCNHHTIFITLI